VPQPELLALAPEGREVVLTEIDDTPFGFDDPRGPAYDAGPSGKPDAAMFANCLSAIARQLAGTPERLDEGYPGGAGRSFRLVTGPDLRAGDVIVIPQGMQHQGETAELTVRWLDGGPDRWTARIIAPGQEQDGEEITISRGWAEAGAETPVGLEEIARHLGVTRDTADKWRTRKLLPGPDWPVGGRPGWRFLTISRWARETGRGFRPDSKRRRPDQQPGLSGWSTTRMRKGRSG
jgi:hypothetical protein